MLKLRFGHAKGAIRRVLCLGSHCDDIEIGCGGTVLRLLQEIPSLEFYWVVFSSTPRRKREARQAARLFLASCARPRVVIESFRDSYFPFEGARIKDFFEKLKTSFSPDLIFTHWGGDLHQDHRLISHLTWNTFRDHLILEYEIPKYDGDLGAPNVFVPLDESFCREKIKFLLQTFESQKDKQWFSAETFLGLLRIRGMECNSPGRYAEAFHCRKITL